MEPTSLKIDPFQNLSLYNSHSNRHAKTTTWTYPLAISSRPTQMYDRHTKVTRDTRYLMLRL
ncbi:hypothetical protein BDQ94DRAFT_136364 [Aspergillus welwitschiae]|uniref:Uncharacterized protein n=1 Tax=Aspergillus welwitschiae TaxID=1341132 RepID=A0A3F3QEB9_9EURO|nr:hypothetical protein BDQ94DRAFT_136364 [Aspergillus welwitschiae]RDH37399.1 hypothetical protein BDQ94DRAFT_136364 [Aspergillus welwitschiae]